MDHKTWLWRRKSSEKTIVANEKADLSLEGNGEEMLLNEKEIALEISVKNLNEKLASALNESNAKDEFLANHGKMAQEAIEGRKTAEAELLCLKQELDESLQQRTATNERLTHLNAALKDYMQQLSSVREEQEQRVRDAVMKTSKEFEKTHRKLEEKLSETSKSLANFTIENSQLSKALLLKEKLIEDLRKRKYQAEAEFNTLMVRLDSTEKENSFMKYEFCMLEKELQIRNEEIEFSRRSADASHKQHRECVKKNSKLEAECQRLRVLVRKRLPGPAALVKMRSEVEIQGINQVEMRRRKSNPITRDLILKDCTTTEKPLEVNSKITFLIERLCEVEEENKVLKDLLAKKDDELHYSRTTCARIGSKLSQIEAQFGELSKVQKPIELAVCDTVSNELYPTPDYDLAKDDDTIHSGSWASALISELEHFRNGNPKNRSKSEMVGVSDMRLMDDFVEMEKLAIVAVDSPRGSSYASSDVNHTTGKELVLVVQDESSDMEREFQTRNASCGKPCHWLEYVLKVILEENRVSKRSLDELLEDIRIALHILDHHPSNSEACGAESIKVHEFEMQSSCLPLGTTSNVQKLIFEMENGGFKDELKNLSSQKDLEARLQLANRKNDSLTNQLRESEKNIECLETELATVKETKRMVEDQMENHKSINEDLDTQLTVAKVQLNEVLQKSSSLEVELEDRSHCCEELETTCLELQLQLESVSNKEIPNGSTDQEEKLHTGWEITAASAKLAECQETILNLGKQLKSLASPNEAAVFDKFISSTTTDEQLRHRSSLRDQMLAEDGAKAENLKSPKTKETRSTAETKRPAILHSNRNNISSTAVGALAIVPSKKRGGRISLLKKLLFRRKKVGKKKASLTFAA